jgi:hypothetical protein
VAHPRAGQRRGSEGTDAAAAGPTLAAAKTTCGADEVALADGDKTLVIDSTGDEDTHGVSSSTVACLLTNLGTPVAVTQQMGSTRSVDGRQSATWPGFSASWTYHPDQGLDIIVTATP